MISINPAMVAGSFLQPEINETIEYILNIINGNSYLLVKLCCMKISPSPFPASGFSGLCVPTELVFAKQAPTLKLI